MKYFITTLSMIMPVTIITLALFAAVSAHGGEPQGQPNESYIQAAVSSANTVIVTITRTLPNETNIIHRTFDIDEFYMWMANKMEDGCDPYVTNVTFDFVQSL